MSKLSYKQIRRALLWRMGLLPYIAHEERLLPNEASEIPRNWEFIEKWLKADAERMKIITRELFEPYDELLKFALISSERNFKVDVKTAARWRDLQEYMARYLQKKDELPKMMISSVATYLEKEMTSPGSAARTPAAPPPAPAPDKVKQTAPPPIKTPRETPKPVAPPARITLSDGAHARDRQNALARKETLLMTSANDRDAASDLEADAASPSEAATQSTASQWKYLPVPDGPDKYTEYTTYPVSGPPVNLPEGLKLIAARVRGKKHKHEGTNGDDWFEIGIEAPWTIIAVSDGAGSKKFSRVGAKASCRAAVAHLSRQLKEFKLQPRNNWSEDLNRDEKSGDFAGKDLQKVQQWLHEAMRHAHGAVQVEAEDQATNRKREEFLGRPVVLEDFSATLLVAVHTSVIYKDIPYSFILTCQVGDGMLAAIDRQGNLQLLGLPDSGDFSGETDFLTSRKKIEPDNLLRKTFPFFYPLQALMVMTDGVADDYFPNDPGMSILYGDLVLNQILPIKGIKDAQVAAALKATRLPTQADIVNADYEATVEALTADGLKPVCIRSVIDYADKLGLDLGTVLRTPELLEAGASAGRKLLWRDSEPEKRLQAWLDSYYVRGSFDDRTLVVLYREDVS
jgi:hypothetical protein